MSDRARNESEAVRRYKHHLQRGLGLVTMAQWITGEQDRRTGLNFLTTEPHPMRLANEQELPIYLRATQLFSFERDRRFRGDWKVRTQQYIYSVGIGPEERDALFVWHWHPDLRTDCHLHIYGEVAGVGRMDRLHLPTRRVSFEQVLRFLIVDLGVRARTGWAEVLEECQRRFEEYWSWS